MATNMIMNIALVFSSSAHAGLALATTGFPPLNAHSAIRGLRRDGVYVPPIRLASAVVAGVAASTVLGLVLIGVELYPSGPSAATRIRYGGC